VSVVTEVRVKNGRDIGDLSVLGRAEKEWLLLPGAVLQTDSVEEIANGDSQSGTVKEDQPQVHGALHTFVTGGKSANADGPRRP
jgi:hypothetical protein